MVWLSGEKRMVLTSESGISSAATCFQEIAGAGGAVGGTSVGGTAVGGSVGADVAVGGTCVGVAVGGIAVGDAGTAVAVGKTSVAAGAHALIRVSRIKRMMGLIADRDMVFLLLLRYAP